MPHRHPEDIASDARELLNTAPRFGVPVNLVRAAELQVEFMESVAAMIPRPEGDPLPVIETGGA